MRSINKINRQMFVFVACLGLTSAGFADMFTSISDAHSGRELSLYEVLNTVAPDYDWTSTAYLNSGAGGRRISDDVDDVWYGTSMTVTMLTRYWGGSANPCDSLGQELVYDDLSLDGSAQYFPTPNINGYGDSATINVGNANGQIIFGDKSRNRTAWTDETLNSAFSTGTTDRNVSFDVSGLDIYGWDGNCYSLVREDAALGSYVLAFDPGSDRDYQDMLVLVEGARIPEPASCILLVVGAMAVIKFRAR